MTETAPDVTEPFLGFCPLRARGLWLLTRYDDDPWPPGGQPIKAVCDLEHAAPDPKCECGVAALYDPTLTRVYGHQVRALIYGWGKVIPGTDGFRAEFGQIAALFGSETDQPLRRLAARYAVPILPPVSSELYRADVQLMGPVDEPFEEPPPYKRPSPSRVSGLSGPPPPEHRYEPGDKVYLHGRLWHVVEAYRSSITTDGGEFMHIRARPAGDDGSPDESAEPVWIKESIHSISIY